MTPRAAALALLLAALAAPASALARSDGSRPASKAVRAAVAGVPAATLDAIGVEKLSDPAQFGRQRLSGPALTRNGKPLVLTANLSWCAHCAANSWALAVALERFGSFARLRVVDTGTYYSRVKGGPVSMDHTKGLSFRGSGYRSSYVAFAQVVLQDREGRTVQKLTKSQTAALGFADGGLPAISFGGAVGTVGSGYGPEFLGGGANTALQVAGALNDTSGPIGPRVGSLANFFSAAICELTGGRPARVCGSPGVVAGRGKLPR